MENHNISTSNMLLEMLGDDIRITVTLSAPTKGIGLEKQDSAATTTCDNHVILKTQ